MYDDAHGGKVKILSKMILILKGHNHGCKGGSLEVGKITMNPSKEVILVQTKVRKTTQTASTTKHYGQRLINAALNTNCVYSSNLVTENTTYLSSLAEWK